MSSTLDLMPSPFVDGLDQWSSENGTAGSATYDGAANAAFVPADPDFGGCLELVKTETTQRLRWTGETPILPGTYLRITAKVKAMSGAFPSVRVAGHPVDGAGAHVAGLDETGPAVALDTYGEVVAVSAIVAPGNRDGVDMIWGADPAHGHFGIDLTGASGGVVRIDDLTVEDVTGIFLRDILDVVDVRDYGAVGDGVADDHAAFAAADAAADGRTVVVPDGSYRIGASLTIRNKVRFDGTLTMPAEARLSLIRNFDLPTYIDAFGDEVTAFGKGFQALMHFSDHDGFDLGGRTINLDAPIDMQAALATGDTFLIRRVIRNGQFYAEDGPAWSPDVATSQGSYNPNNPLQITGLANAAQIQPGSQVTGKGVGREVYVTSVNVAAGTLQLSQPLYGPDPTQDFTFTRYKYILDFMGFENLRRLTFSEVEFQMNGYCNGVILSRQGENMQFKDCFFIKPRHKGITSAGRACQDLHLEQCQWISNEQGLAADQRISVGFNVNANDSKIRDCRFQRMGLSGILNGTGHNVTGTHVFQGDDFSNAPRVAGLVFTREACVSTVTGNYIDNCAIEWTNEHDASPDFGSEYGFGGLTITGNIFYCSSAISSFRFIRLKPYGTGHFLSGLQVNENSFYAANGTIDRVEAFDDSIAGADYWRFRNITFERNNFNGVTQRTMCPVCLEFNQGSNATTWTLDPSGFLPFGGNARTVTAVVAEDEIRDAGNARVAAMPQVRVNQGAQNKFVQLVWPEACRGTVHVTVRCDKPI
ncbi:right-handed parallel beta-helix repeat-containing protein [Maritimibacter sp. DP07]|uniref:Right-handed parallel beta-helix repeat-containing protein n=1 Tax=Maritimibacter harenae TaxID=2606218 RepID=A0A845M929_9RHOB|nr:glycosyl hydrolase family 28-related protein [Maritimibacter harenae]MZR14173.1 right-handed parallel beta-helix repeat-containing protein [Maritimibacter harenae]